MKAILLAAGKGTRLRPYTDTTPKCLMPICGEPIMKIWLDLLVRHSVTEVLINTHHQADAVERFIQSIRSELPIAITTVHESVLLGSAGTLWHNRDFLTGESDFIIAYGDNLTDVDLTDMVASHRGFRSSGALLTMGLFRAPVPEECGIAVLDASGKVIQFTEKPDRPVGNLANGGIYVASSSLFDHCPHRPEAGVFDLGHHVLPALVGQMYGYELRTYLRDIGTLEAYQAAQTEWKARGKAQ